MTWIHLTNIICCVLMSIIIISFFCLLFNFLYIFLFDYYCYNIIYISVVSILISSLITNLFLNFPYFLNKINLQHKEEITSCEGNIEADQRTEMNQLCTPCSTITHSTPRTMKSRSFSRPWLQLKNVSCCLMIVPSDWLSWTAFSANCIGSLTFALISTLDGMALLSMCRTREVQVTKTGDFRFLKKHSCETVYPLSICLSPWKP